VPGTQFYYDGTLASSYLSGGEWGSYGTKSGTLTIGFDQFNGFGQYQGSQWVDGDIAEIDVWQSALDAAQISQIDAAGSILRVHSRFCAWEPGFPGETAVGSIGARCLKRRSRRGF
jgi:hypothetical protein